MKRRGYYGDQKTTGINKYCCSTVLQQLCIRRPYGYESTCIRLIGVLSKTGTRNSYISSIAYCTHARVFAQRFALRWRSDKPCAGILVHRPRNQEPAALLLWPIP